MAKKKITIDKTILENYVWRTQELLFLLKSSKQKTANVLCLPSNCTK